jgi:UDP-N-acetylmuramate dehydrogenase
MLLYPYNSRMTILQDVPLSDYSTMRLGGNAAYLIEVAERAELREAVIWAQTKDLPIIMVGIGSNIVWKDEGFPGLILVNRFLQYVDFPEDDLNHYVTIGAGEVWDTAVERTVEAGLSGIEALSLIPGTVGATPIQNVGAYGQDISQTLSSLEAYDIQTNTFVNIPGMDCRFGYRASRFKDVDRGRYLITAITLHLSKGNPEPPFYGAVQHYFAENNMTQYSPRILREAVIAIRSAKLPDPAVIPNNGSFFGNPIIDGGTLAQLQSDYPDMPHWETDNPNEFKIPAAWLIEQVGFKDYHDTESGMATWPTQTLVLINEHAQSTASLLTFKQKIVDAVKKKFTITLVQEPELLPTT